MRLVPGSNDAVCHTPAPPMRQALWLSFQVSEPGSPGAGIVKVRQASLPSLTSQAPTQLLVPSWPPVLSPCRTSSLPPLVLITTGAPVKPWVLGDGVPVAGSVGALASTSQITSPESRLSAIMRMSLVETKILFPYIAMPRLVRDCLILGSYRHNGTAASPLRTSNFVTRVQVSATYMKPSSTRGVDSSLPRSVPPVARPPIEKMNFGLRSFAVVVLICVSGEWRELL